MSTVTNQRSVGESMATTGLATAGITLGHRYLMQKAIFNKPLATRPGALAVVVLAAGAAGTAVDYTNRNGDRNSMLQSVGLGAAIMAPAGLLAVGLGKPLRIDELKPGLQPLLQQAYPSGRLPRVSGGAIAGIIGAGALTGAVVHALTSD